MTKTIQLAKPYTKNKLGKTVYLSEKLDGVPIRVDLRVGPFGDRSSLITMRTRQDEHPTSCQIVLAKLMQRVDAWLDGRPSDIKAKWASTIMTFVGEVTHETYTDFKDVSGVVRRSAAQDGLVLNLFDFSATVNGFPEDFARRHFMLTSIVPINTREVSVIKQFAADRELIDGVFDAFMAEKPNAEGMVVRDATGKFQPGKRTWCYQKLLRKPTIELALHSVEEATTEYKEPKGMVGRLNFWYKGEVIGVGPGKLTHEERTRLWERCKDVVYLLPGTGPIATVQYKEDKSYDALREPTFQHWRTDKDTPDA